MNPLLPAHLQRELVLASSSPRRADILRMLGFEFEVAPAAVDEEVRGRPEAQAYVRDLALLKAEAASAGRASGLFIGADTVVAVDGDLLGKPVTEAAALDMLRRLRGRWHSVYTGVALLQLTSGRRTAAVECTEVRFQAWDDDVLRRYVATGECMDKAGGYAIQGFGALLVSEVRGCFYNVMGFPVTRFAGLLLSLGQPEVRDAR